MNITNIQIRLSSKRGSQLASASVVIDNAIVLHGIKVMRKKDGETLFVSMAGRYIKDGHYVDVYYHPSNTQARAELCEKVLEAYHKALEDPETTSFDMGDSKAEMTVSSIRLYNTVGEALASVSLVLDDCLVLGMMAIRENRTTGEKWLSMPTRKMSNGMVKEVFHPISVEAREKLCNAALRAYQQSEAAMALAT